MGCRGIVLVAVGVPVVAAAPLADPGRTDAAASACQPPPALKPDAGANSIDWVETHAPAPDEFQEDALMVLQALAAISVVRSIDAGGDDRMTGLGLESLTETNRTLSPHRGPDRLDDGEAQSHDAEELAAGAEFRESDTDGERLIDGTDVTVATDPLDPDTDGDGVPDGEQPHTTVAEDDSLAVRVELTGPGDVASETIVKRPDQGRLSRRTAD